MGFVDAFKYWMKRVGMKKKDGSWSKVRKEFVGSRKLLLDEAHPAALGIGKSQGHGRTLGLLFPKLSEANDHSGKMVSEGCVLETDVLVKQLYITGLRSSVPLHCFLTTFLSLRFLSIRFMSKFSSFAPQIHLHPYRCICHIHSAFFSDLFADFLTFGLWNRSPFSANSHLGSFGSASHVDGQQNSFR